MNHITIAPLQTSDAGLESFTYARYRALLRSTGKPGADPGRIAMAAWVQDMPVGLALMSRAWPAAGPASDPAGSQPAQAEGQPSRRLLSVMVHPLVRRTGIGAALLARAEAAAVAAGTRTLVAVHSSRMAGRAAFEALLQRAGWAAPQAFEHRLAGHPQWALAARADWGRFLQRLAERGYSAADWTTLCDADRHEIRRLVAEVLPEADRSFDPFADGMASQAVPELSLLLRRHGRIVGWIRGSRGLAAGSFHYGHGYVLPEVQRLGWLQAGVREVCERQHALFGPQSLSVFETSVANEAMQRFMARQLGPYQPAWTDTRFSSLKRLA